MSGNSRYRLQRKHWPADLATIGGMLSAGVLVKGTCGKCGYSAAHNPALDVKLHGPDRTLINCQGFCPEESCAGRVVFVAQRGKHSVYQPLRDDFLPDADWPPIPKTIADVICQRYDLRVECGACKQETDIPYNMIDVMVSPHLSMSAAATKFKCTSCDAMSAEVLPVNPLDNW